jgi:hypothetical protein
MLEIINWNPYTESNNITIGDSTTGFKETYSINKNRRAEGIYEELVEYINYINNENLKITNIKEFGRHYDNFVESNKLNYLDEEND